MRNVAAEDFPQEVQSALESLYRAIIDPATWADALHQLAQATNSAGCFFYPRDQARALLHLPVSPELREFIDAYVEGGWFLTDPRALRGWSVVEEGHTLITDDDFMLPGECDRSPYFQEFQQLWKIPEWAAVAFRQDANLWCLSLLRSGRQGPIAEEQKPILKGLSSHLGRIVELATILDRRENAREIEMLERACVAAVLLDWKGAAVAITTAAEALFGHDFSIQKGQFSIRDSVARSHLKSCLEALNADREPSIKYIVVEREDQRPIILQITSLPKLLTDIFGRGRILVRFHDAQARVRTSQEVLRMAFGLTPAEVRLVAELANQLSPQRIADKFGVSKETIRVQLNSIFRKTSTHRQAELISLVANLPRSAQP